MIYQGNGTRKCFFSKDYCPCLEGNFTTMVTDSKVFLRCLPSRSPAGYPEGSRSVTFNRL